MTGALQVIEGTTRGLGQATRLPPIRFQDLMDLYGIDDQYMKVNSYVCL
jgi:hypothetical protein